MWADLDSEIRYDPFNRAVDVYLNGWVVTYPIFQCPCPRFIHSQPAALQISKPTYDPANFPSLYSLGIFEANHSVDYPLPDIVPFGVYSFAAVHDREHHKRICAYRRIHHGR